MYHAVPSKVDFPALERETGEFWKTHRIFEKSMEQRRGCKEFVFYDGPPFATGLPHYGHLLAGTIKDIVPRYQTMRGFFVDRRFGWDCHGLPVEYEVEQDLKISGKRDIEKMGVGVFNEHCRSIVLRYTREWRDIVTRMGRWVDFDHDYKTMDPSYMESIWWVFKTLWDKNLVYEGYRVVWYCPRCATPLSNFETNQGYENVQDPAVTVRFALQGEADTFVLAWTTTPWTLPSNTALAVGNDIVYVKVQDGSSRYWLAESRLPIYYKSPEQYTVLERAQGRQLVGRRYEPLFPYFADAAGQGAFRILAADYVSTEDGTGIVHVAPAFGEEDSRLGQAQHLPAPCPVDAECRFTGDVAEYAGRFVKEADADIIRRLKSEHKLIHQGTINHAYPHCWRCDAALISRAISAWYVRVEQIRDRLLSANAQTRWVPEHLRDGRFGKWLEGARDWNVSRNRYWGAPLPIWRSADGKEVVCVGSIAELEQLSGRTVTDLHKHHVDDVEIRSRQGGGPLRRIPEVLDCWFESGAMPYAQAHYPFENKAHFEKHFPADFIAEGLDQTRGWFYTLMVLSTALFDKPAFRNVVVNGLILAEDGKKMSKRLRNYPDPVHVIETHGADALRLYMIDSAVVKAEDLRFSEEGVKHLVRHILIPLWNAYSFFVTYANIDGWTSDRMKNRPASANVLDRWIHSSLETLIAEVTSAMDNYDLQKSVRPFVKFIDDLTNWYIRRSRRRFWKSQDDEDKAQAYATLNYVLLQLSKVAAPFIPFMSDVIYRNLRTREMPESVHLCDFPAADGSSRDPELEAQMATVMTVVQLGRLLRAEHDLKVRQPLSVLHVVSRDGALLKRVEAFQELVLDELNVKALEFSQHDTRLAVLKAKPDFKKLGPRLGANVKKAALVIGQLDEASLEKLNWGEAVTIAVDGQDVDLEPSDVVITRIPREGLVVASEGALVVALEKALTEELILEGTAREIINRLQNQRKHDGLDVEQRIRRQYHTDEQVRMAEDKHGRTIDAETLCVESTFVVERPSDLAGWEEMEINGHVYFSRITAETAGTDRPSQKSRAPGHGGDSE